MSARELLYMSSVLLVASGITRIYKHGYKYYVETKDKSK